MEQLEYDPDKAKFYLQQAGLDSLNVDLSAANAAFEGAVDAAQLYQASASAAGININVVQEPSDGYWSNVWLKKPWCACYWGGRPTEDWMYASAYVAETEWNDTAWRDTDSAKKFNEVVVAARAELDPDKRRAMYYETQALVNDDGGTICPMFANYIHGVSKKVGRPEQIAANWELDGARASERWWFA